MANILDYLTWRGDLTLKESPFNEVDNLILARLSYFDFDGIIKEGEIITIQEAAKRYKTKENKRILQEEDTELFPFLGQVARFQNMKLAGYVNKIEEEAEKQFSAITIYMPDNSIYVSYRGTDNTIVGWKEDLNMSFKPQVPAQIEAVTYLEKVANKYYGKVRVGGHSKGGNLAVYAAAFCNKKIEKKIINVYNNDGPGFDDFILETENYQNIVGRVETFVPQSSVIGRLLGHEEKYLVVKSVQKGIMQHDLYSWQVEGKKFVSLEELTNGSQFVDKTIKDWLKAVSPEQRGECIDILFQILESTEATTMSEISRKKFNSAIVLLKTYKNVDEENKRIVVQTLEVLLKIAKDNLLEKFPKVREKKIQKEEIEKQEGRLA
ncbi:MAG: DUF2974 domain-containing protein [Clostridia bacterium]